MSVSVSAFIRLFLCLLLLAPLPALAGTVVRVSTALGDFDIELLDDVAPVTVANFLAYLNKGAYNGTVVHRLVPGFVIQGGWLSFNESQQTFYPLATSPAIVNEFKAVAPNRRGTLAMAKLGGDPNSATSQWFINLQDNPSLNTTNGGYAVFGRVMGNGMQIVDRIGALPPVTVFSDLDPFPLINYTGGALLNRHVVSLNMRVLGSTSGDPIVFDGATATLHARINAGELGLIQGAFRLVRETPAIEIQLDAASVFNLEQVVAGMGSFDSATGRLTLPELRINGAVAYRNVRFVLVDAQQRVFRLEGAE